MKNNLFIYLLSIIGFLLLNQYSFSQTCTSINAGTPGSSATCYDFDASSSWAGSSPCAGSGHGGGGFVRIIRFCTNASTDCVAFDFSGLSAAGGTAYTIYGTCTGSGTLGSYTGAGGCDVDNANTTFTTSSATLSPNTCYYLRVWTKNAPTSSSSLCISSIDPPNDVCTGAEGVDATPSATDNYCTTAGPTTNTPTITPGMLCAGSLENTAWYSFTAVATADIVMTLANFSCSGGGAGYQIGFFSGTCGSLSNFGCTSGSSGTVNVTITGVTAGQTVYVAIDGNAGANCTFDISATNTVALPIKLLDFTAKLIDNNVNLNWVTETETNNDFFTIERSFDGVIFETVSIIKGAGNSNNRLTYSSKDLKPKKGTSYYRLKQTDYDGKYSYSSIESVVIKERFEGFSVFPNPVTGNGYLTFDSSVEDVKTIVIYDISGRLVYEQLFNIEKGNNKLTLETQNLTQGMYFIKMINEDGVNLKFIKD